MTRVPAQYIDPLDQIWLSAATDMGLRVERASFAYASTDGKGTLTIALPADLDPDDCLAQIILHELCHFFTQGETSVFQPDWGLSNDPNDTSPEMIAREHAALRLQAALLRLYGLQKLLAPTTDFRSYYDALPENPLHPVTDPTVILAQQALQRSRKEPYRQILLRALQKTAAIHRLFAAADTTPVQNLHSFWHQTPPSPLHPTGVPYLENSSSQTCGTCVWSYPFGKTLHCRREKKQKQPGVALAAQEPACVRYESHLHCQSCAACCKEAYDVVPIRRRDLVLQQAPEWVETTSSGWSMKRDLATSCCAALQHNPDASPSYACKVYDLRPQTCHDVVPGEDACLFARIRLGLCL